MKHKIKNYLFLGLSIVFPLSVFSQIDLKNISLTDSNLAILYSRINNEIEITGLEIDSTIILMYSNGKAEKSTKNNVFIVKPSYYPRTDTLSIYKNNQLVFTEIFEIRRIRDPQSYIGNKNQGKITIKEIISNPELIAYSPDCYYKFNIQVISFVVSLPDRSSDSLKIIEIKSTSNKLSEKQIEKIKKLKDGDGITFQYITAQGSDKTIRTLNPIALTIKEED